jgi:glutathione S-transferase
VLPTAPRERALCHALEEFADEAIYFQALYYHWHDPAGREQAHRYFARTLLGRFAFRPFLTRIERQLRGHGTSRKSAEHVRSDLERNLDAIEAMLEGRAFFLGDGPYLCDYAIASQLAYLKRTPAMKDALTSRPNAERLVATLKDAIIR